MEMGKSRLREARGRGECTHPLTRAAPDADLARCAHTGQPVQYKERDRLALGFLGSCRPCLPPADLFWLLWGAVWLRARERMGEGCRRILIPK